jgi:hypothetical protein
VNVLFLLLAQKKKNQKEKGTSAAAHDFLPIYNRQKISLRSANWRTGPLPALVLNQNSTNP